MHCFFIVNDSEENIHTWNFVYLHGKAEANSGHEYSSPDILFATEPMPKKAGTYYGMMQGHPVIIVLAHRHGHLGGRAALIDDTAALRHVITPSDWQ